MAGRILIISTDYDLRKVLSNALRHALYSVACYKSVDEFKADVFTTAPVAILVGPDHDTQDAKDVIALLQTRFPHAPPPVFKCEEQCDRATLIDMLSQGIQDIISLPISNEVVKSQISNVLRRNTHLQDLRRRSHTVQSLGFSEPTTGFTKQSKITLVSHKPEQALLWKASLTRSSAHSFRTLLPATALQNTRDIPDLIILHGDQQGLQFLRQLQATPHLRDVATLMIAEPSNTHWSLRAVDLGVGDVVSDGFDHTEALLRIARLLREKATRDRLQLSVQSGLRASITDPLTGLYNRRYAIPYLNRLEINARTQGTNFAVMMLDIDHFKSINDKHGHLAGDTVLTLFAKRIQSNLRSVDMFARVGGEEFLIVLPDTSPYEAQIAAERIRVLVTQQAFAIDDTETTIPLTVSIGMTFGGGVIPNTKKDPNIFYEDEKVPTDPSITKHLMQRADKALYTAKTGGRNTVIIVRSAVA